MAGWESVAGSRIALPERFEKTRLAVMSYSAAAIVLSIATSTKTATIPSLLEAPLDITVLRWLALFAATAYWFVFVFTEVPAIRAINRNFIAGKTWDDLRLGLNTIPDTIVSTLNEPTSMAYARLNAIGEDLNSAAASLEANHKAILYLVDDGLNRASSNILEISSRINPDNLTTSYITAAGKFVTESALLIARFDTLCEDLRNTADMLCKRSYPSPASVLVETDDVNLICQKINILNTSISKLHTALSRAEQNRLNVWEIYAPTILYVSAFISVLSSTSIPWYLIGHIYH